MSRVIAVLRQHAAHAPKRIALEQGAQRVTYAALHGDVETIAARLREHVSPASPVALLADNGADWIRADLAALAAGVPVVPIPLFFSAAQVAHALRSAGIETVLANPDLAQAQGLGPAGAHPLELSGALHLLRLRRDDAPPPPLPPRVGKITFTSGTTAEPKGVCLSVEQIEATAEALRIATDASADDRHLCLLPLPTLLENIGGVYTPLLAGATIVAPPLAAVGLSGSSGLDVKTMMAALDECRASSAILVPQMLDAMLQAIAAGIPAPRSLRFVAVGGAPVGRRTLARAARAGLPVYEGYGLSECASVVALNEPGANRPGSVGRPLPHARVELAADGEILVGGIDWPGYLGAPARADAPIATGDLGRFDDDGYLYVSGRKKSVYITAFGRNVAPEWVERELVAQAPIAQAALFGDGRAFNTAIIVARGAASEQAIAAALADVNRDLPDYARVGAWIRADAAFSVANGLSTANGRLRREPIFAKYADRVATLYRD